MDCADFAAGRCRSCSMIELPYPLQLETKQSRLRGLLGPCPDAEWLDPVPSPEAGFRNKAKMAVGGSVDAPQLGLVDLHGGAVDLGDCPLYPPALRAAFAPLRAFITLAGLVPYDLATRRGELKYVLLTLARDSGALMLRFVLRSQEPLARIRRHLAALHAMLPGIAVVSLNLQPQHKAVLEGEREILLGPQETLTMRVNGLPLHLQPRSFFQTNDMVAASLYAQARTWAAALDATAAWDLYCGVGGFALHLADGRRRILGIECSEEAVASARRSAQESGAKGVSFVVDDATGYALRAATPPPLVVVNPPRRGIGEVLARHLAQSSVRWVIYSSCNPESLQRDLVWLSPLRLRRIQMLDMFPHTPHFEVLTLLERRATAS